MSRPARIQPGPGQESVWDYPRPPRIEPATRQVRVVFAEEQIASSSRALRVLETAGAPTYYIPADDVRLELLIPAAGRSTWCEWKGSASYLDVVVGDRKVARAGWIYRDPTPAFRRIQDHVSFYPALVEAFLDDERVQPQPGGFYGGWVTGDIVGPIKGEPGSAFW
ncbi:MAG: DUF427 domain-containing protein [Actinomycetota bacterium]